MKKTALLLLLAACFSMPAIAGDGPRPIKLISYNLRNSGARDGDNAQRANTLKSAGMQRFLTNKYRIL